MKTVLLRWLPGVTLATWSGTLLYFYYSGRVKALLHPAFREYVVVAGFVLLVIALVTLVLPSVAVGCEDDECGHPLGNGIKGRLLCFLVLIFPLCGAAIISPDSFGKGMVLNRGITNELPTQVKSRVTSVEPPLPTKSGDYPVPEEPVDSSVYLEMTEDGNIKAEVVDLIYAAQESDLRPDFENKNIEIIGQYFPAEPASDSRFRVVRMFMVCCAADARPVAVSVNSEKIPELSEMAWIRVKGKVRFPLEAGKLQPVIDAESIDVADPPEDMMLY